MKYHPLGIIQKLEEALHLKTVISSEVGKAYIHLENCSYISLKTKNEHHFTHLML